MDKNTIRRTMIYVLMPFAFIWYCMKRFGKFIKKEWLRILLYSLMPLAFIVFCLKRVDKRVKWFRPAVVYMVIFTMLCTSMPVDVMAMPSAGSISGRITSNETWNNGAFVSDVTIFGGTAQDPIVITVSGTVYSDGAITIAEDSYVKLVGADTSAMIIRNDNTSSAVVDVNATATLEVGSLILDGGAVWGGTVDTILQRETINSGKTASTSLIKSGGQRTNGGTVILNNGAILQNNECSYAGNGGAVTIGEDGVLTINGAIIKNNQNKSGNSGAIKMYAGSKLTLNNGEIYGNKAYKHGGAIQIFGGESTDNAYVTFHMTGGTIRNNLADGVGGAVAISDYSVFNISGGSIINNATTDSQTQGGGVGFRDANTSMSISGNVTITGNMANGKVNNLYIGTNSNNILTVNDITDGSAIGVYIASPRDSKVFSTGGASDVSMFSCDNEGYEVAASGNNLKLVKQYTISFDANSGTGTMVSASAIAGSDYTLPECGFVAPCGYDFKGWSIGESEYKVGDSITMTADVEVKALWKPQSLRGTVSISGLNECEEILSATVTDSNNTGVYSYQWYRIGNETIAITNATESTYTLTTEDVNSAVYCVVTSSVQTGSIQSAPSENISLKKFSANDISIETFDGVYDAQQHSISITVPEGATITYRTSENESYSATKPVFVNAENYTVYYKVSKENYEDYIGQTTVVIKKAPLTIKAKDDSIIYGEKAPVYAVTYHGFVTGEDEMDLIGALDITCDYRIFGVAGDYTITPSGYRSDNYEITYETGTLTVGKQQMLVVPTDMEAVSETILGKGDGKIAGLTTSMEYSMSEDGPFTKVINVNMNFAAGTYYVRFAESDNYNASESVEVVVPKGPAVQITTQDNPKFDLFFDSTQLGWHGDASITLTPKEGYTLTPDLQAKVNGVEVEVDIQANQKAVFFVEDIEGDIYVEVTGIIDVTVPTIKIAVAENTWNKFWNDFTFGILFNETQTVTITAQDTGSGVDKVFYYISKKALTYEEVESLHDWVEYKKAFDINPENEFLIYVKAVDREGNIAYINSDNLILLFPGNYEDVTPDTNFGSAKLDVDIEELKQDIPFTEKELEQVKMGADVDVWLSVEEISDTVSNEDKKLIAEKVDENQIGMYIDVSMFKQVGTNPTEKLTQLNDNISITFEIPETLILDSADATRIYQIIRVHDSVAEILDTYYDAQKNTLTFETDCFSTYAILYKDEEMENMPASPPIEQTTVPTAPKTADSDFSIWVALLFVSGGVMYQCVTGKKKTEETE